MEGTNPSPQSQSRAHIALLIFAGVISTGIFVLLGIHVGVPTTLYALDTAALIGAGVAIPTA